MVSTAKPAQPSQSSQFSLACGSSSKIGAENFGKAGRLWVLGAIAALAVLVGCRASPLAQAQWDYRVNNMRYPIQQFAVEEARRPAKLEAAGEWIESSIELDKRRTQLNPRAVEAWFQRDVDRMRSRDYERGLRTFFGGNPERIAPNAIKLFF